MARLLPVNVGLPRNVSWWGERVFAGVWKEPVQGRRMVRRLNVDGDGQGDFAGYGGEHRAVLVYQIDIYRYWERHPANPPPTTTINCQLCARSSFWDTSPVACCAKACPQFQHARAFHSSD